MSDPSSTAGAERWPRLDPTRWLLVLWHQPVLLLLVFALGAGVAFTYSYAPLHRAKDWRIGHLEERLASRNAQTRELEKQLAAARQGLEGAPSRGAIAAVESRLAEATRLAESRAREVASLERNLEQSRTALRRAERANATARVATAASNAADPLPASAAPTDPITDEIEPDWEMQRGDSAHDPATDAPPPGDASLE